MKNTFGNSITLTVFGESHSAAVGVVIDSLPAGIAVDYQWIDKMLTLRRPFGKISTSRQEKDEYEILSGVFGGYTTGTPICISVPNTDVRSKDYEQFRSAARPSHADYTAFVKYGGYEDYRGGGHFSGRVTTGIVAAAGIIIPALRKKGIMIGSHITSLGGISDRAFGDYEEDVDKLYNNNFPVLDGDAAGRMQSIIEGVAKEGDSIGGVLETIIAGLPAGLGEPFFDSMESMLSHAVFSIPAVKGIEFGAGFDIASMLGSAANDSYVMNGRDVATKTNNNGGINGGITNGMPITFKTAIKPTPTISIEQQTVDFINKENTSLKAGGRHDPCIVHRARAVVDSVAAFVVLDMILSQFGKDWLFGEE